MIFKVWNKFKLSNVKISYRNSSVLIPAITKNVSLQTLQGFNNTGNVRIWPSEELLLVKTNELLCQNFQNDIKVLEIGGGYSSLAGVLNSKLHPNVHFTLTDGNPDSVASCHKIIETNSLKNCSAMEFVWGADKPHPVYQNYSIIIIADCFFFDNAREKLAKSLQILKSINNDIKIILIGPTRNGTFEKFINLCNNLNLKLSPPEIARNDLLISKNF